MRSIFTVVIVVNILSCMGALMVEDDDPLLAPAGPLPAPIEEAIALHILQESVPTNIEFYPNVDPEHPAVFHTPAGPFRVIGDVGEGVNGPLLHAICEDPGRCGAGEFAIKVVPSTFAPHPLLREFEVLRYLDHLLPPPALSAAPIYVSPPVVLPDGREKRYLVSRLAGLSVEGYAATRPGGMLSLVDLFHFWAKTLKLVERLHSAGLVHCDIHSGNVLFADPHAVADLATSPLILIDFERTQLSDGLCARQDDLTGLLLMGRLDCPAVNTLLPNGPSEEHPTNIPHNLAPEIAEELAETLDIMYESIHFSIDYSLPPDYQVLIEDLEDAIALLS